MHAHTLAVQVKFWLPAPLGHLQTLVPPQALLTFPHAVPMPGVAGHEVGAQQTFGVTLVLQS
jgi:hypothetical protein